MAELSNINGKYYRSTMRQWVLCFVVCNFNVDIGPEIEFVYPPGTTFSQTDLSTICFNSFPERHDGDIEDDMYFNFALRNNSPDINLFSPTPPYGDADLFHGVSVFRQEYDGTTKRSFNQKSLVIISSHDFAVFFMTLLRVIVTGSNLGDVARLEAACSQIEGWASPRIGKQELPFMGGLLNLDIPPFPSFPLSGNLSPFSATTSLLSTMSATEPTESWVSLLPLLPSSSTLYILYECLIVGDPVIVLGQNPQHVSSMCTALLDLVRPVSFAGIVRPYIPMQSTGLGGDGALFDPSSRLSFIAGITNPFLLQRYSNAPSDTIPYILALVSSPSNHKDASTSTNQDSKTAHMGPSRSFRNRKLSTHTSVSKKIDVPGTPIRSQARPTHYIKQDRSFIDTLSIPDEHGASGPALTIRRHFTDVTARLLAPINRYMATTSTAAVSTALAAEKSATGTFSARIPPPSSALKGAGAVSNSLPPNFSLPNFLANLAKQESPIPFVGQMSHGRHKARDAFYTKFCSSANFRAWLDIQSAMEHQIGAGVID